MFVLVRGGHASLGILELIVDPATVAHALLRAVFALLRTQIRKKNYSWRSQECERGTE
jgi:hypothetical protein